MEYVFGSVAIIVAILIFKSGRASKRTEVFEAIASGYSLEEAQSEFEKSYWLVVDQMADPLNSFISNKQAQDLIEQMVALKNRINQIEGLAHGPKFRRGYRFSLLKELKQQSGLRLK